MFRKNAITSQFLKENKMQKERLDKLLSHEGFGSRKDIKKLLRTKTVILNDKQIFDSSIQINPTKDKIFIDNKQVDFHKQIYIMMNKPKHTVSSSKDNEHQTVFDLLEENLRTPYLAEKLHTVGRLDMDTEGMLLLTTDGNLTHRLISPKSHIKKTYYCELEHAETKEHQIQIAELFKKGIKVTADDNDPGFICKSAEIQWQTEKTALLTIYEGKYHQVKRMFIAVQNKICYLKRISIGNLMLDKTLSLGKYKFLTQKDLELLNPDSESTNLNATSIGI